MAACGPGAGGRVLALLELRHRAWARERALADLRAQVARLRARSATPMGGILARPGEAARLEDELDCAWRALAEALVDEAELARTLRATLEELRKAALAEGAPAARADSVTPHLLSLIATPAGSGES